MPMAKNLVELRDVYKIYGEGRESEVRALDGVSLTIGKGESLGLVGETGAGKTTTALSVLRLIADPPGKIMGGEIWFEGEDMLQAKPARLREIRGSKISVIFQDPMTSLNPVYSVGDQIAEVIHQHEKCSKEEGRRKAGDMLEMVGIPAARGSEYPHQFSGGMKQRLGIAQAELNAPDILILDEPTAGLDPKERVRFRNLISDFAKDKIVILSTHIVSDVSYIADTILMMKDGTFLLQEPMATITDSINGKVWELLVSDREAAEYSRRFSVVNLHHENGNVRLRMIHDTSPAADAITVPPSLEDLFLYHFGEERGE